MSRLENAAVIGFEAVQNFAAHRHDGLELRVPALLDGAHGGIALDDIQLPAGGVAGAAVHKLLHPVGQVHLGGDVLFDADAGFFSVLAALLVDQHLLAGFFGLVGVLDEIDLQLVLEKVGHSLGHKLVGDGLFGLVFRSWCGWKSWRTPAPGSPARQAKVMALSFFLYRPLFFSQLLIWLTKARRTAPVGAAAVLQPAGVVVVFQRLHRVGEAEGHVHADLVLRLVGAVAAGGLPLAEVHRGQGVVPRQLGDVIGDAVFVIIFALFAFAGGAVVKGQRDAGVDHRLPLEHIPEGLGRHGDVGEHVGVRLPADDRTGAPAGIGLLFQAAHIFALFEIQVGSAGRRGRYRRSSTRWRTGWAHRPRPFRPRLKS